MLVKKIRRKKTFDIHCSILEEEQSSSHLYPRVIKEMHYIKLHLIMLKLPYNINFKTMTNMNPLKR